MSKKTDNTGNSYGLPHYFDILTENYARCDCSLSIIYLSIEALFLGEGRGYVCPQPEFQTFNFWRIEEEAFTLLAFYYGISDCPGVAVSVNPSLCCLSPFQLSFVTASRRCCLSDFTQTGP